MATQQQRSPKISFREIFRVVRFSTFATVSARSGRLPAGSWAKQTRKRPSRANLQQVGIFAEESLGRYSTHAFVIDNSDHPAANGTRDLVSPLHRVAQLGDAANRLDQDTARDREINRCHFLIQQNQGSATI